MKKVLIALALTIVALVPLSASGPLGIYAIVERVVFEPNDSAPERVQVWGAFAYADIGPGNQLRGASDAKRGFMYFRLHPNPEATLAASQVELVRREWSDLKSVAGTGQAVAFGKWDYIGMFDGLAPDSRNFSPPYILERVPAMNRQSQTDLRVRPATEKPASPAYYQMNVGVVKLTDTENFAAIIQELRRALK
jgi:hypothetical protein